jgi:hypothetical protein
LPISLLGGPSPAHLQGQRHRLGKNPSFRGSDCIGFPLSRRIATPASPHAARKAGAPTRPVNLYGMFRLAEWSKSTGIFIRFSDELLREVLA